MATKYTTNTLVLQMLKGAGTSMTTSEIDEIINMCEAYFDTILKIPSTFTFNAASRGHQILRLAVTLKAAMLVIASTPQSYNTLDQAGLALDLLYSEYTDVSKMLKDSPGYMDFVEAN